MMQVEDRTYYEEEQKMEGNWLLIFMVGMTVSTLAIAVAVMYNSNSSWTDLAITAGAIVFSDTLIFYLLKTMKLEIAISKKGIHYKMFPSSKRIVCTQWDEVTSICIRKSPNRGYGKKIKFRYGEIYSMNTKEGVELTLTNGKKKFFSLKYPDEFKKNFRKLDLTLQID